MMRALRLRLVALAVVAGVVLSGCEFEGAYDLPLPGSGVDADESYVVTADFQDVMNVVPKSPVMVDDVPVGVVTEVDRVGWAARLTMRIRDDVELPDNAIAEIRQTSLLGEKYVALEAPTDPSPEMLGEGDRIPMSATGRNPEVEEVLGALSFLLSGGGVGQLSTISSELNNVMTGRTDDLKDLLGSLDNVVGTIDGQKSDIIHALESLNNLATTLNKERGTIGEALDVMGPAVAVLADQQQNLMKMLRSLDRLGEVGTRVIGAAKGDVLSMLDDLRPVLARLDEAGDSLPRGLSLLLSFPFPDKARTIVWGDYANAEIQLDISLRNFIGDDPVINPGETLTDLQKCLRSGGLLSTACAKFLKDVDLFQKLKDACKAAGLKDNPVCKAINLLPVLSGLGGTSGSDSGSDSGGLLGLLGLRQALTSDQGFSTSSDLYGRTL
jgi:phospholipid/cholesterol/gamma-HCH transport system substrate-binding protein